MALLSETVDLELFPGSRATLAFFQEIQNVQELKQKLMDREIEAAMLTPKLVISPIQVLVAVNKAMHAHSSGHAKTKNVNSEIIFSLSPSSNISESFKRHAMAADDTAAVVVILNDDTEQSKLKSIAEQIAGKCVPLHLLSNHTDEELMKARYKISEAELDIGSLEDAVICKIATKDVS
ncbi:EKC/KEOPS complex subunit Tprkb-like [Diadema antillarum]|uniref:EKC/KEOPS complex subunit Tprkb-like n=1 Tax=Diadema antillarum TaxID=105358 RepID=UPI003A86C12A